MSTISLLSLTPKNLRETVEGLNLSFLEQQLPWKFHLNSEPQELFPLENQMKLPFDIGGISKMFSTKNTSFFNRTLKLCNFDMYDMQDPGGSITQFLVLSGMATLPLMFASFLKTHKFDCVSLSYLPK